MFGQIGPTPYDLYFSIFGIPVRVNPAFWAVAALLGWGTIQDPELGPTFLLVWIACIFFSILIHELGHAFAAKYFGWPPQIFLYHMGGVAVFQPHSGYTTGRSIFVSFAGPAAGFILYGLVIAIEFLLIATRTHPGKMGVFALMQLEWINLMWGLINLLPVVPLDGGRICEQLCLYFRPRDGAKWALKIAIGVSGAAAFYFFQHHMMFAGILFGLICYQNFQALQFRGGRPW